MLRVLLVSLANLSNVRVDLSSIHHELKPELSQIPSTVIWER